MATERRYRALRGLERIYLLTFVWPWLSHQPPLMQLYLGKHPPYYERRNRPGYLRTYISAGLLVRSTCACAFASVRVCVPARVVACTECYFVRLGKDYGLVASESHDSFRPQPAGQSSEAAYRI